jgi:hypothetical protein
VTFSYRQILASAAGAVIAALIASTFGVAGTIVGVAIGSMAATMGTALVAQSIERGQKVVKQAVVRVPEGPTSTLLRRMGGTGVAGGATSSVDDGRKEPEPTEVAGAVGEETTEMEPTAAFVNATERVEVPAAEADAAPVAARFEAETVPLPPSAVAEGAGVVGVTGGVGVAATATAEEARGRRFTWKAFAGTAAIVFVLALGVVTAVELLANRPTVFTPSSPPASTTTTTSTPATTSTSTSAPTSSTTTSTSAPSSTTTSTSAPSSTSTTNVLRSTTTTTAAPAP